MKDLKDILQSLLHVPAASQVSQEPGQCALRIAVYRNTVFFISVWELSESGCVLMQSAYVRVVDDYISRNSC